jgi:hypothetical protein
LCVRKETLASCKVAIKRPSCKLGTRRSKVQGVSRTTDPRRTPPGPAPHRRHRAAGRAAAAGQHPNVPPARPLPGGGRGGVHITAEQGPGMCVILRASAVWEACEARQTRSNAAPRLSKVVPGTVLYRERSARKVPSEHKCLGYWTCECGSCGVSCRSMMGSADSGGGCIMQRCRQPTCCAWTSLKLSCSDAFIRALPCPDNRPASPTWRC